MNKTSSKLAAGMRKVKTHQESAVTKTEARKAAAAPPVSRPKPAPASIHPDRVWPD
jgi:hypothetical protein